MTSDQTNLIVYSYEYQLLRMLRMFVMWTLMYVIIHLTLRTKLPLSQELDMKNRLISIVHGLASFGFCLYYLISRGFNLELPMDYFNSGIISLSFSYFLYDLIACLFYGLWDIKLIIHHMLCIVGMFALIWFGRGICVVVAGLVLAEASNLPMHVRCIFRSYGLKYTKMYDFCESLYMWIYIIFRGVLAPVLFVLALLSPSTPIFIALVLLGIMVQSFFFISTMIGILKKKKLQEGERKEKNVELFWFEVNPQIYELDYVKSKKVENVF